MNPHTLRCRNLNPVRLPIPPLVLGGRRDSARFGVRLWRAVGERQVFCGGGGGVVSGGGFAAVFGVGVGVAEGGFAVQDAANPAHAAGGGVESGAVGAACAAVFGVIGEADFAAVFLVLVAVGSACRAARGRVVEQIFCLRFGGGFAGFGAGHVMR